MYPLCPHTLVSTSGTSLGRNKHTLYTHVRLRSPLAVHLQSEEDLSETWGGGQPGENPVRYSVFYLGYNRQKLDTIWAHLGVGHGQTARTPGSAPACISFEVRSVWCNIGGGLDAIVMSTANSLFKAQVNR